MFRARIEDADTRQRVSRVVLLPGLINGPDMGLGILQVSAVMSNTACAYCARGFLEA